jgi:agmatinase
MSELPGVEIVQIGLRSTSMEEANSVPSNVKQFWAEDILADFPAALNEIMQHIGPDVYLTFDVDACDPSWVPNTGTPEPGGLSYYQVRDVLRAVCAQRRVRALDCVELIGGHTASAFAIARLLYKAMGYISTSRAENRPKVNSAAL